MSFSTYAQCLLGPNEGQKKENLPFFIHTWIYQPLLMNIGVEKYAIISYPLSKFRKIILPSVQPYFREFIPALEELQQISYRHIKSPKDPQFVPTHEMLLDVFKKARNDLYTEPNPETIPQDKKLFPEDPIGGLVDVPNLVDEEKEKDLNNVRFLDGGREGFIHSEPIMQATAGEYILGPPRVLRRPKKKINYTETTGSESGSEASAAAIESDESYIPSRSNSRAASKVRAVSQARAASKARGTSRLKGGSRARSRVCAVSDEEGPEGTLVSNAVLLEALQELRLKECLQANNNGVAASDITATSSNSMHSSGALQELQAKGGTQAQSSDASVVTETLSKYLPTLKLPIARSRAMSRPRALPEEDAVHPLPNIQFMQENSTTTANTMHQSSGAGLPHNLPTDVRIMQEPAKWRKVKSATISDVQAAPPAVKPEPDPLEDPINPEPSTRGHSKTRNTLCVDKETSRAPKMLGSSKARGRLRLKKVVDTNDSG